MGFLAFSNFSTIFNFVVLKIENADITGIAEYLI